MSAPCLLCDHPKKSHRYAGMTVNGRYETYSTCRKRFCGCDEYIPRLGSTP